MKVYTIIESIYNKLENTIESAAIHSTSSKDEASAKFKDRIHKYYINRLLTPDNELFMRECEKDPRMTNFANIYEFFTSSDEQYWSVNEWGEVYCIQILTTDLSLS